mgnify:CR=1 FL=1
MSDTKTIHESIIRDIIDLANIADGDDMTMNPFSNKVYKSVAAATDKLTLIFPVFCSNNISIENSVMVSKAIERKCVTMMQMLFSAMQISDAKNAIDYISKFHGNLDASLDDVANLTVDDLGAVHMPELQQPIEVLVDNYCSMWEDILHKLHHNEE